MKRFILFFLLLTISAGLVKAQTAPQTYWPSSIPPKSNSYSGTTRVDTTSGVVDSTRNHYFSYNNKWNLYYTATQSNLRFLKVSDSSGRYISAWQFLHGNNIVHGNWQFDGTIQFNGPSIAAAGISLTGDNFGLTTHPYTIQVGSGMGGASDGTFQAVSGSKGFYNDYATNRLTQQGSGTTYVLTTDLSAYAPDTGSTVYFSLDGSPQTVTQRPFFSNGITIDDTQSIVNQTNNAQILWGNGALEYYADSHDFKNYAQTITYLHLGDGSASPLSNMPHLQVTGTPVNPNDVIRLTDLTAYAPATGAYPTVTDTTSLRNYSGSATIIFLNNGLQSGTFIYYPAVTKDDGGVYFTASGKGSGTWVRQFDGLNTFPEWYGALRNGTNDDAIAINKLFIAASDNGWGNIVLSDNFYYAGTTIRPKKNVSLIGPVQKPNNNDVNTAFVRAGRSAIKSLSTLTGDVILLDFQSDSSRMPYNVILKGFNVDMTASKSTNPTGVGIHLNQPTTGWGPQGDGFILNGLQIDNVMVINGGSYGIEMEPNISGGYFNNVAVAYCNNHGFYMEGRDTWVTYCFSFLNNGDGFYSKGNSMRITGCDWFLNQNNASLTSSGHGVVDEGFANFYRDCTINENDRDGIRLIVGTTAPTTSNREIIIAGCRLFDNSKLTDNTYSEAYIEAISGTTINASFIQNKFSYGGTGGSSGTNFNEPTACISTAANATGVILGGNFFDKAGLSSSSTAQFPATVTGYADMSAGNWNSTNYVGNTPNLITTNATSFTLNGGSVFETQNSSATTISSISGGKANQHFIIIVNDNNTTMNFNGSSSHLWAGNVANNNASYHFATGAIIYVTCLDGTNYYCLFPADMQDNVMTTAGGIPAVNSTTNWGSASSGYFNTFYGATMASNGNATIQSVGTSNNVSLKQGSTTRAFIAPTTGNFILNGTVDSTAYRLQVPGRVKIQQFVAASSNDSLVAFNPSTHGLRMTKMVNGGGITWNYAAGTITPSTSFPLIQGSADLVSQTSAGNITTFTVGASTATFNISAYLNVTAISTDVIQVQVTYTDENSTSQTVSYTTLNSISDSNYNPVTIRAKNGTVITVKTNLTVGAGSVTFDAGARIVQL